MDTVVKIINLIVKRSSLTHRQFQSLLGEMDCSYKDIPLHCAVRWLSAGKVLERFVSCLDAIKAFLLERDQDYPELEDEKWIMKLMFLTDITGHLKKMNLRLEGAGQTVLEMYDAWVAFISKLAVFQRDVDTTTFRYFRHLGDYIPNHTVDTTDICKYMLELKSEFKARTAQCSLS